MLTLCSEGDKEREGQGVRAGRERREGEGADWRGKRVLGRRGRRGLL